MSENNSDCLIIVPVKNYTKEPGWETLLTQFGKNDICLPDERSTEIGIWSTLKKNALTIFVLWNNNVHLDKEKQPKLTNLLKELYDWFYVKKLINLDNYNRKVFCGHFHVGMSDVRNIYEEAVRKTDDRNLKTKLKEFADPISGQGNFIFESYTIGGEHNKGATFLINELGGMNLEALSDKNKQRIPFIFRELFDFFWYQHKLPELISNMKGHLFIRVQSGGKCGSNELKDSIDEFKECGKILRDEYEVNEDLSLIYKVRDTSMTELNHEEIGEINDQLDRILLAILKKRAGKQ